MPKANSGKRLLNLPEAAYFSAWSYNRGVEHGRREMRLEYLEALSSLSEEIKTEIEGKIDEKRNNDE